MYKWTKKAPTRTGFYWLNILKKDGTSRKGFPRVVEVKVDDRTYFGANWKVPKGTLIAWEYWCSTNQKENSSMYENYRWSSSPVERPK